MNRISVLSIGLFSAAALFQATASAAEYDRRLVNTYHGQEKFNYCGVASIQMMLDSDSSGSASLPLSPLPSQDNLFTKVKANNDPNARYATDPKGMQATLAFYDPPANGRTYVAYSYADFNSATRTLAYNVDHYSIPGSALITEGDHWIDIVGVKSSIKPSLATPFTVNGFYVRDPWSGFKPGKGLGKSAYLGNTADGLWKKRFTAITNDFKPGKGNTAWTGKYAFVTDPDPDTEVSDTTPSFAGSAVPDAATARAIAAFDISNDGTGQGNDDLDDIPSFSNGAFGSAGEMQIAESDGDHDWIVPYYQTGDASTPSGVALIDAETGALNAAFWDDDALHGDSLSDLVSLLSDEETGLMDIRDNLETVPEPASLAACGLALLAFRRRRRA